MRLYEDKARWPIGTLETDFKKLLKHYKDFDHPSWTRQAEHASKPGGASKNDFAGFLQLIKARNNRKPQRILRLEALARKWRKRYVMSEITNFFAMCSLLLAIVLIVYLVSAGVLALLVGAPHVLDWVGLTNSEASPDWAKPTWENAVGLGFGILLATGLRSFLVHRLADVEAWSTYSETDSKFKKEKRY